MSSETQRRKPAQESYPSSQRFIGLIKGHAVTVCLTLTALYFMASLMGHVPQHHDLVAVLFGGCALWQKVVSDKKALKAESDKKALKAEFDKKVAIGEVQEQAYKQRISRLEEELAEKNLLIQLRQNHMDNNLTPEWQKMMQMVMEHDEKMTANMGTNNYNLGDNCGFVSGNNWGTVVCGKVNMGNTNIDMVSSEEQNEVDARQVHFANSMSEGARGMRQCVTNPEYADAVMSMLHELCDNKSTPKSICLPIRAAMDAGVISRPTARQYEEEFAGIIR